WLSATVGICEDCLFFPSLPLGAGLLLPHLNICTGVFPMAGKVRPAHVSVAPTNPRSDGQSQRFDVAELYRGPAAVEETTQTDTPLDERLRQAYFWIVNNAIISPHYDIEYNEGPPQS